MAGKGQAPVRLVLPRRLVTFLFVFLAFAMTLGTILLHQQHSVVKHQTPTTSMKDLFLSSIMPLATTENTANKENQLLLPLPQWFLDYARWHAHQLEQGALTPDKYQNYRFLVLRCLELDKTCGGLSDRLKPLPLVVLLAAQTNRIFLIAWSRPCPLEEFLLPPKMMMGTSNSNSTVSIDWRAPNWLIPKLVKSPLLTSSERVLTATKKAAKPILCVQLHDQHGGSDLYNKLVGEPRGYRKLYGPLFWALFEPTRPLAAALAREQAQLQLVPGAYAAAHLRAYYSVIPWTEVQTRSLAVNAVQCARQLRPGVPIFFASDSQLASEHVRQYYSNNNNNNNNNNNSQQQQDNVKNQPKIITLDGIRGGKEALHLDRAESRNAADYYNVFLDVLHFASAKCIAHGQGGFGRLGVLLSKNASCMMPFIAKSRIVECHNGELIE